MMRIATDAEINFNKYFFYATRCLYHVMIKIAIGAEKFNFYIDEIKRKW